DATLLIQEGVKAKEEFEKTGKVPGLSSTDNAEFQIVLSIIKEGLSIDPLKYHKMKEILVRVSEETTTGVKRLYQIMLLAKAREKGGERVWMKSAIVERELENIKEEMRLLNECLELYPLFFKLWLMFGQLKERLGRLPQAKKAYELGLKQYPNATPLWLATNLCLLKVLFAKSLAEGLQTHMRVMVEALLSWEGLIIATLRDELRRLKGKSIVDTTVTTYTIDPEMLKVDVEPIAPRLLNNRTVHSNYLRLTHEQTPSGNTKKDKIQRPPSSTQKNKIEAHPRTVKSSLKNKKCAIEPKVTAIVQHSKLNANSELICVKCNGCMLFNNHDLCVPKVINDVNARAKSKSTKKNLKRKVWKPIGKVFTNIRYIWIPTGLTFTIVGNTCPLTRITITTEVPSRNPIYLETDTPKPIVTLVYERKPRKSKTTYPVSKSKVIKYVSANKKEPNKSWGSTASNVPSSSIDECMLSKLFSGTVKFGNDHMVKIMGYGDYQIGNVMIIRVYYVEGLGHELFSVGQFCDSNLEVAFRHNTCYICNLEGVDLLTGSRGKNLYTLSLGDMMAKMVSLKDEHTLIEAARTMLIYAKAPLFLWAEAVATAFYTQNCSIVLASKLVVSTGSPSLTTVDQDAPSPNVAHMNNDPYYGIPIPENDSKAYSSLDVIPTVIHNAAPNSKHVTKWTKDHPLDNISKYALESLKKYGMESSDPVDTLVVEKSKLDEDPQGKAVDPTHYRGMVGTLMYLTANRPDLTFVDSFIALIAYADADYTGCQDTRQSTSDFDELTAMASEQSSSGPTLQEMTPATISSGLVPKPSSSTSYVPPTRKDWDLLFQSLFDELLNPPPSVDNKDAEVIAPIEEVI
nr:protein stabilized1-like [Tanacetum cinerariifolium]